jgi:gluconolactonase
MHIDVVAAELGFTEGPVWLPDGRIALTSVSHGCLYIIDPAGGLAERIVTGGGPNGLALGPDGALYVAQNGGIFGASGKCRAGVQIVADGRVDYFATGMEAPNDLVFGPDGRLWVTDTRAEPDFAAGELGVPGWVWACAVDGSAPERIVDDGPVFINGLAFTGDERSLLVTSTLTSQLLSYAVAPAGAPSWARAQPVHTFDNGWPDGMVIDESGSAWVALTGADRIDAIDAAGNRCASIDLPAGSLPTNVCIGGPSLDELYVTAAHGQSLLRVRFDDGDPHRPTGPSS